MIITRQNPNGGPVMTSFPLKEDPETGMLGYQVGYCPHGDPLLIRTLDIRLMIAKFGISLEEYEHALRKMKPKLSLRVRIIRALGGKSD